MKLSLAACTSIKDSDKLPYRVFLYYQVFVILKYDMHALAWLSY